MPGQRRRVKRGVAKLWVVVKWVLVFVFILFALPALKQLLFPDLMTRMEKMLRRSGLAQCVVDVARESESLILLNVKASGESPIAVELYREELKELPEENEYRVFVAHSINHNPDQSYYLTETRIWADVDLKRVLRLEAAYCGRLRAEDGRVAFDGDLRPVYECVDPVQRYVCDAAMTE